jgi:hypothetical protein
VNKTLTAVMAVVSLVFVAVMVRMQHDAFAERARRSLRVAAIPTSPTSFAASLAGGRPGALASGALTSLR